MEEIQTNTKTWISLGNRQFYIEDVLSIFIQKNHLIINFDYTDQQIVIFFGRSQKGYENCKKVFTCLEELYNAHRIEIPDDAILNPDLLETAYGDKISKTIQDRVHMEKQIFKKRHKNKLDKALKEIQNLKDKLKEQEK